MKIETVNDLVSIIMPVHNAGSYIGAAIQSVLNQTHENWELLIVNDGSTDNTEQVISQLPDSRIKYFYQLKQGVSSARNKGLREMNGSFFCFLDADDALPRGSIKARLNVLSDGDVTFADGRVDIYDGDMRYVIKSWAPRFSGNPFRRLIQLSSTCFFGPTWMIRVEKNRVYCFDEEMTHAEDLFFFTKLAISGTYAFTNEIVSYYRRNPTSAMRSIEGLGRGYSLLRKKIRKEFSERINFFDLLYLQFKTRKIMFLSYLAIKEYRNAVRYLITG